MKDGEEVIRQEDCSEDVLGLGILTLTNKRIVFEKTESRMLDFTKRPGDTVLDVPLNKIAGVWSEGIFMKKVCIEAAVMGAKRVYKFGVLGTGGWTAAIEDARGA